MERIEYVSDKELNLYENIEIFEFDKKQTYEFKQEETGEGNTSSSKFYWFNKVTLYIVSSLLSLIVLILAGFVMMNKFKHKDKGMFL